MGSEWAPIFCASVASMREQTFLSCFHQFRANQIFHHRYVDNRDTFPAQHWKSELDQFAECFENSLSSLHHPPPILLEPAHGSELLGYNVAVDVLQITVTYVQIQSTSTSKAIMSGTLARMRLILTNEPPSLQIAQTQEFFQLLSQPDRNSLKSVSQRKSK